MDYLQVIRGRATQKLAKSGPSPKGLAVFCPAPSLRVAYRPLRVCSLLAPRIWSKIHASQNVNTREMEH